MRYQIEAPILAHEQLAEYEYEITVRAPEIAREAQPGQFVQVLYDHTYNPFTRRPFSVYKVDREAGNFSIVYLARGVFTLGMRKKRAGDTLSVVGPLGNTFQPDSAPDAMHLMIAGGVGAPPLYFMAKELSAARPAECEVVVVNGARTRSLLVAVQEFTDLGVDMRFTTDDGSHGLRGIVTDALREILDTAEGRRVHVYTCGPTPMLRAVAEICVARGVPCQVSVETVMPCGLGVCMGCVVKLRDAADPAGFVYKRSCYDGPVFRAEEILWE